MSGVLKPLHEAVGTGGVPDIFEAGMAVDTGELREGIWSVSVEYFADEPRVPLITVLADSEERALSVYEALRATVSGLELFPASLPQESPA